MVVASRTATDIRNSLYVGYTYLLARDEVRGFNGTTSDDPSRAYWMPNAQHGMHRVTLTGGITLRSALVLSVLGTATSGFRYTPRVGGDVNADGLANDRAYVVHPSREAASEMALGMARLLSSAPSSARACLSAQLGNVAAANSCRGPWTTTLHLQVRVRPGALGTPQRLGLGLTLFNALAAADRLAHSARGMRGWGSTSAPESELLRVRGFDAQRQRFLYDVNPRFGQVRTEGGSSGHARLTLHAAVELGPDTRRIAVERLLRSTDGAAPSSAEVLARLPRATNVGLLTLLTSRDSSIGLSDLQRDSLRAINTRLHAQVETAWLPVATYVAGAGSRYQLTEFSTRVEVAEHQIVLALREAGRAARHTLTAAQVRKLPAPVLRDLIGDNLRGRQSLFSTQR